MKNKNVEKIIRRVNLKRRRDKRIRRLEELMK
jgi:hypothetical protein